MNASSLRSRKSDRISRHGARPGSATSSASRCGRVRPIAPRAKPAGMHIPAARANTDQPATHAPATPIAAAARPLPREAKRTLRPSRRPSRWRPTRATLIAAIAWFSMQLAKPCRISASPTPNCVGASTKSVALAPSAPSPIAAASRLPGIQSTSRPAGIWLISATIVPSESTPPMASPVQWCSVR